MDTPESETTSANKPEATLRRRTEKEWRHEDRELTGTLALGRIVFAIQGAIIPITALVMRDTPTQCDKIIFVCIVLLSFLSMIGCATIPYLLIRYDRKSAIYYSIIGSGKDYEADFNKEHQEEKRRASKGHFDFWRPKIELVQAICFAITAFLFTVIILTHD